MTDNEAWRAYATAALNGILANQRTATEAAPLGESANVAYVTAAAAQYADRMLEREQGVGKSPEPEPSSSGAPWTRKGAVLLHGTKLRIVHRKHGIEDHGEVLDGVMVFDGAGYIAPSPAVSNSIRKVTGRDQSIDGWLYIQAMLDGKWRPINSLRRS